MNPGSTADNADTEYAPPLQTTNGLLATRSFESYQDSLAGDSLRDASRPTDLQSVSTTREVSGN